MALLFEGILYKKNPKRFEQIREIAAGFSEYYIGQNIIQDDIFNMIENYVRTENMPLEWLRFPIRDPELCACTFIRSGRIFVMVNSGIPMSKQIFAAAHELYHIRCFLEEDDLELAKSGSILNASTIETGTTEEVEMEANAFAGILLVPVNALKQQMGIYQIKEKAIEMKDILTLMDIFAVPYKAMILRLLEEKMISDDRAREMIDIPFSEIQKIMKVTGKAKRWDMIPSGYEKFGSLLENLTINTEQEVLPKSRLESDWKELDRIKQLYGIK
nr:ImmA/IrrE family metallo-endopeptidase [uncultured Blautia sp.]